MISVTSSQHRRFHVLKLHVIYYTLQNTDLLARHMKNTQTFNGTASLYQRHYSCAQTQNKKLFFSFGVL